MHPMGLLGLLLALIIPVGIAAADPSNSDQPIGDRPSPLPAPATETGTFQSTEPTAKEPIVRRGFFGRRRDRQAPPDITDIQPHLIEGPYRERVLEILNKPVSWFEGQREMFPCNQPLLEWLIDHPHIVGEYWKQLGISITDVEKTDDGFICREPTGSVVHFYVACDQPGLRICYCIGESPAGILPIKVRAELVIVHRYTFEEYPGAGTYVSQKIDGFATASGATLKLAMKLAPGQAEQMVEACVHEMKVFFSVMCRLMQLRPWWSLEKLPELAKFMSTEDTANLESILKSLPPQTRPSLVIRRHTEKAKDETEVLAVEPDDAHVK